MLEDERVALQLVVKGSEFEDFLLFRDALLDDIKLVERYNQMKRACTKMNTQQYREVKSRFIEEVLNG